MRALLQRRDKAKAQTKTVNVQRRKERHEKEGSLGLVFVFGVAARLCNEDGYPAAIVGTAQKAPQNCHNQSLEQTDKP